MDLRMREKERTNNMLVIGSTASAQNIGLT